MAFPADAIDTADLKALLAGGLVNEDVLKKIFDISEIPCPFLDLIGSDTCENSYTEWAQDELGAVDPTNGVISGSDVATYAAATGSRVGNHTQISRKAIAVSERARNTSNIGTSDQLMYEVMKGLQRLRRDVESIVSGRQASVADDGSATAGKTGGFSAWLITNDSLGAGGAATGFNTTTKVVAIPTTGTTRALSWGSMLGTVIESVYTSNGNPTTLMTNAALTRQINIFLNAPSNAYKAAQQANVTGTGPGVSQTAQGYYQVIKTDFGFNLEIVPNRLLQTYTSEVDLLVIDPSMASVGYLDGFKVKELGKNGLSDRRDITVDYTVKVFQEKAHGVVRDLTPGGTVVA